MRKSLLFKACVNSQSGYGQEARDRIWALIKSEKFDIQIIPIKWGVLPLGALDIENERNTAIKNRILRTQPTKPFDYFLHHSVPNEFEKLGNINIGITAGVETDRVSPQWLEKINIMDMVIVPSVHSKLIITNSGYHISSKENPTVHVGQLKCERPVEIVFEGVDTEIFNNDKPNKKNEFLDDLNKNIKTDFNFVFVGHWLNGGLGEDRKNVGLLIKSFLNAFDYNNKVGLIIKTAIGPNSVPDKYRVIDQTKRLLSQIGYKYTEKSPKIYIVHGSLTDEEISFLYKFERSNAFVSLTHGEGYGRPFAEAAACNLPIIAPNWSGQIDFLNRRYAYLLDTKMNQIPQSVVWPGILEQGSQWCSVEESDSIKALKEIYHNYDEWKEKGKLLGKEIRENWNMEKMCTVLVNTILNIEEKRNKFAIINNDTTNQNPINIPFTILK